MPRQARLDAPGLVHHVMARGIEGGPIFRTAKDRETFLDHLEAIVTEAGGPTVYAWALIPNHFHLLVRPAQTRLSTVMQRLMTGYAVIFNKVHKRVGHLFQNRFKSIVVEEDPYFLELVRYIHLNPVRAGLVASLKELGRFRWSGHAALLGYRGNNFQSVDDVLLHFSESRQVAVKVYEEFVAAGIAQGTRQDLRGGGLIRSAGGVNALLGRGSGCHGAADERILGSGDFVDCVLQSKFSASLQPDAHQILAEIAESTGLPVDIIIGPSKERGPSDARTIFYLRAHEEAGISAAELGRLTGRTHVAVVQALKRAREKGKRL